MDTKQGIGVQSDANSIIVADIDSKEKQRSKTIVLQPQHIDDIEPAKEIMEEIKRVMRKKIATWSKCYKNVFDAQKMPPRVVIQFQIAPEGTTSEAIVKEMKRFRYNKTGEVIELGITPGEKSQLGECLADFVNSQTFQIQKIPSPVIVDFPFWPDVTY